MPICFVCGKKMNKNRKKDQHGNYKRKFIGLLGVPSRDFCSKRHLNKYFKNKKKYEERSSLPEGGL